MLKLVDIKKDYVLPSLTVHALKGVNITFRENEFVSILGQSGCGKTTLLNIIGGLDHYTSGDLIIDGISTKRYKDRDWDLYRNHKVGFIFQSYNLIPHQTILENVELALTISGVSKKERRERSKEALDKVGLKDMYSKKPNQLSGGQCQRVAIARALVNNPSILLADEPTGALDSETSIQIMDLIKEISSSCLVIMVTHNPELAYKYSTRIVKLLDGSIIDDSNPYNEEEIKTIEVGEAATEIDFKKSKRKKKERINEEDHKKYKKAKLSFWQAYRLSQRNLRSKFKRSLMVCIAGSIGIIGVATVLSVSNGVTNYINSMQNDMLSGNPIQVSESGYDLSGIVSMSSESTLNNGLKENTKDGYINVNGYIEYLLKSSSDLNNFKIENNITKEYLDFVNDMDESYYKSIVYKYGLDLSNNIYTSFKFEDNNGNMKETNMSLSSALNLYTELLNNTEYSSFSSYIPSLKDSFMITNSDEEFILDQYDIISGSDSYVAKNSDEIMIVVDENTSLTDLLLAQYGYYSQDEFLNLVYKVGNEDKYDSALYKDKFSYSELLNKTFTYYFNDSIFNENIVKMPKTDAEGNYVLDKDGNLIYESTYNPSSPFTYNNLETKITDKTNSKELKITAILRPKDNVSYGSLTSGFYYTDALAKEIIENAKTSKIVNYLNDKDSEGFTSMMYNNIPTGIYYTYSYYFEDKYYENKYGFVGSIDSTTSMMASMMGASVPSYYSLTLRNLGGKELPWSVEIYPTDFNYKDEVTSYLDKWNEDGDISLTSGNIIKKSEREDIKYNDNLSIVISLVNNLINIVTYALVSFTALSLVVSTVMVAIITYVSVIERIKEIGVIRSMGGRKRDVSNLFIAETLIIGGLSGIIGIGVTYLISFILNLIMNSLFGITIASLTWVTALVMVLLSIILTLISGVIPANSAAHKDPVEALRSE